MIHSLATTVTAMLCVLSCGMIVTGLVTLALGDLTGAAVLFGFASVAGIAYVSARRRSNETRSLGLAVNSAAVAIGWFVASMYAALPIWIIAMLTPVAEANPTLVAHQSFVNAWYDGASSVTSAGLTSTLRSTELTPGIQLWRSVGQWIGGVGMAVVATRLIASDQQSWTMYRGETRQWTSESLNATLRYIGVCYLGLTFACGGLFWIAGMPPWEAINHSLIIASTGGLTVVDDSFASYSSTIRFIACVFMILGAISFSVIHLAATGRWNAWVRRSEVRAFFFVGLLAIGSLATFSWFQKSDDFGGTVFNLVSAMSTCGVSSGKLSQASELVLIGFVIVMLVGGCSDSTAGGLKINRVAWIGKVLRTEVRRVVHPDREVALPSWNGRAMDKASFNSSSHHCVVILALGVLFYGFGVVMLRLSYGDDVDLMQILFQTASANSTVGLSMDLTGPDRPVAAKLTEIFLMVAGRLEWMAIVLIPFVVKSSTDDNVHSIPVDQDHSADL